MSRPATSRLKVNPALGAKPALRWLRLDEMFVDLAYQRTLDASQSQSLIRRIAQFWDWNLCQPLTVAKRANGALMIVDGQHRHAAAKLRSDIETLPCVVSQFASSGDEAAAFVALNQQRRPLSALDLFKAAIAAEDSEALLIFDCIQSAGLSLAPHMNNKAWKPGQIANIGGLRTTLRGKGEKVLRDGLMVISHAFPNQVLRFAGTLFPGIAHIVANEPRGSDDSEIGNFEAEFLPGMIDLVGAATQAEWSKDIIKVAGELNCARRDAASKVFEQAWVEFLDAYFEEDEAA